MQGSARLTYGCRKEVHHEQKQDACASQQALGTCVFLLLLCHSYPSIRATCCALYAQARCLHPAIIVRTPHCPPPAAGLDLLEPLASASGGSMLLYPALDSAAVAQARSCTARRAWRVHASVGMASLAALFLPFAEEKEATFSVLPRPPCPQDVYKSLAQPRALACMLRLRCSPELELRGAHGRLVADRSVGSATLACKLPLIALLEHPGACCCLLLSHASQAPRSSSCLPVQGPPRPLPPALLLRRRRLCL